MVRYADAAAFNNPRYNPIPDTAGFDACFNFGCAMLWASTWRCATVPYRMISYSIDPMTHIHLANRHNGYAIDPKGLSGSNGGPFLVPVLQGSSHDDRQPVIRCGLRVAWLTVQLAFQFGLRRERQGWSATDGGRIRGPLHVRQGGLR